MERLGTTLHWASLLPAGYRVSTRADVAAWLGWREDDALFTGMAMPPGHMADRIRGAIVRAGLQPQTYWSRFAWCPHADAPVVLCMTASRPDKRWHGWEALRARLDAAGVAHEEQTTGSLDDLEAQLTAARAVVAVDSGPMHLAAYAGVPTVGLFVTTRPAVFGPRGMRSVALVQPNDYDVMTALHALGVLT